MLICGIGDGMGDFTGNTLSNIFNLEVCQMEIKFNNMLEVANLILALEARIKFEEEILKCSTESTFNIYNQIKEEYKEFIHFEF